MADTDVNKLNQITEMAESLLQERDQYHELYLEERIKGLDAQLALAGLLKEQAVAELRELKK